MSKEVFETVYGCVVAFTVLPIIALIGYFLFHIILWLIPFLLTCGIIIFILYIFLRGLASFCK